MRKYLGLLLSFAYTLAGAATLNPIQLLNPTGSTSGQAIVSTGASTAPAWSNIAAGNLSPIAGNTVLANASGSSAAPSAFAMPSCSTSASALNWTTSTGFTCNTAINAATLGGATFASPGSIGSTTPGSGAFTTLSASGTITPSQTAGIVGTTTNNNANAGSVGEFVTATGTAISLTNNTPANITSISLTAGDWDVTGAVEFDANATTNITGVIAGINTTSATLPAAPFKASILANIVTGGAAAITVPTTRISVTSTTTVYIVGQSSFNTSTATATGFIRARRVR